MKKYFNKSLVMAEEEEKQFQTSNTCRICEKLIANIVTRNDIVWKLARGYFLCYCKTFLLVPDSAEGTKLFTEERSSALLVTPEIKYYYRSKENHQYRKTLLTSFDLKISCA